MTSYNTQQTIHLLPLCIDVTHLINSFLFQEIKTFVENKKKEIVKKFENAVTSRKNGFSENEDDDTNEHWAICLQKLDTNPWSDNPANDIVKEKQFQAINCQICGNYKMTDVRNLDNKILDKIMCKCAKV
jgi:hypothetical protein